MAEDREHAGEERHPLAVDLGELVAQVAHQRLRHGQTDGRLGSSDSSPSLVIAPAYEMWIDKARLTATNVAKLSREGLDGSNRRARLRPDRAHACGQHRRASAGGARRACSTCIGRRPRTSPQRSTLAVFEFGRGRLRSRRRRCRPDRQLHPDPCRLHRGSGRRRQAGALREADRPQPRACQRCAPMRIRGTTRADHARFRAPLRSRPSRRARRRSATGRSATCTRSRSPRAIPAWRRSAISKESGGIFRDMTIHDFDMARFVLGEEVDDRLRHRQPPGRSAD